MPGALDSIALADVIAPCRAKAGQQGEILHRGLTARECPAPPTSLSGPKLLMMPETAKGVSPPITP